MAKLHLAALWGERTARFELAGTDLAAERAWRAGAISYPEWVQLQSERTALRRQQLDVALDAQRAPIELQRLTDEPLLAAPVQAQGAMR